MCINGSLCKGTRGFCGEIGHCSVNPHGELCSCGNRGCLELYVSTRAILERVRNDIATGEKTQLAENTNITLGRIYTGSFREGFVCLQRFYAMQ